MADHNLFTQVRLACDSALPEDVFINTFSWFWDDTEPAVATDALVGAAINTRLTTLYGVLDILLSENVDVLAEVRTYDRGDTPPRVPIFIGSIAISPGSAPNFPNEVAIVTSFQGTLTSGLAQARRRGRIYIGPIAASAGADGVGDVFVGAGQITTINNAMDALQAANTNGLTWHVWSTANGSGTPVTNGWTDNAFDTQRRRGKRAQSRSVWSNVV